MKFLSSELVIP